MPSILLKDAFLPPPELFAQTLVVSLVDMPATDQRWVVQRSALPNGEQTVTLTGPVLLANQPLLRHTGAQPYWLRYTAEGIKPIAQSFEQQPSFSLMHQKQAVAVTLLKSWFTAEGTRHLGQVLPPDSWMVMVEVDEPELVQQILEGRLTGFSLEGTFEVRPVQQKLTKSFVQRSLRALGLEHLSQRQEEGAALVHLQVVDLVQNQASASEEQAPEAMLEHQKLEAMPPPYWNQLWQWLLQLLLGKAIEVATQAASDAIADAIENHQKAAEPPAEAETDEVQHAEDTGSVQEPNPETPTTTVQALPEGLLQELEELRVQQQKQQQAIQELQVQLDALAASPAPVYAGLGVSTEQPPISVAEDVWLRMQALRKVRAQMHEV